MRERCPNLLTVDHPIVAVVFSSCREVREIASGVRFAITLTPDFGAVQNAGEEFGALRVVAKVDDGGTDEAFVHDANATRAACSGVLLIEDDLFEQTRATGTARLGPTEADPTMPPEFLFPIPTFFEKIVFIARTAATAHDAKLGAVAEAILKERSGLDSKRILLRCESQVHAVPDRSGLSRSAPKPPSPGTDGNLRSVRRNPNWSWQTLRMRFQSKALARCALYFVVVAVVATNATFARPASAESASATAPRVGHVWIFVLENTNYAQVTAESMPYFSARAAEGVTLSKMYGVGHASLTNYIAMASGHKPKLLTQQDCFSYNCLYGVGEDDNIANQLEAKGLTWKAYMDGMTKPCPKPKENSSDPNTVGYATRHNPFMYYRSIVDNAARCAEHVRPYGDLATDLKSGKVANYNFISPDTCHDAHDVGDPKCSLTAADSWLEKEVAPILDSPEYKRDGAIILTFDEAFISDASSCCGEPTGGGHIATALLSPHLSKPGSVDATPYSHYSLLRTMEDNFGLAPLRQAGASATASMIANFNVADTTPTPPSSTNGSSIGSTTSAVAPVGSTTIAKPPKNKGSDNQTTLWVGLGLGIVILGGGVVTAKRRSTKLQQPS